MLMIGKGIKINSRRFFVRSIKIAVVFCMLAAMVTLATGCRNRSDRVAEYGDERVELSKASRQYLLDTARAILEGKSEPGDAPDQVTAPFSKEVFIYGFRHGSERLFAHASKGSMVESTKAAARQIQGNSDFDKHYKDNMGQAQLVIAVMDRLQKVPTEKYGNIKKDKPRYRRLSGILEPGIYSILLVDEGRATFLMAHDFIYNCWGMRGQDRIHGWRAAKFLLHTVEKKAGLSKDSWIGKELYRFTTVSFVESTPGGGSHGNLYRTSVLPGKDFTRADILEAAYVGGRNLGYNQAPGGKFGYIYYPCSDTFDPDYNIVRHAGTTYSLFQLYQYTGDPYFKDIALAALEFLSPHIKQPEENPELSILEFNRRSDLGANALLTLALIEMPDNVLAQAPQYRELRDRLGATLLAFQMEDGSFYKRYRELVAKRPPKKQPIYYPGETFLAFVRLYETTGEDKYLAAAKKAAEYQINDFKKSKVPDNWAIQAYGRYHRHDPQQKYADACFEMAEALLKDQWGTYKERKGKVRDLPFRDFYGGYVGWPPRSTPAASRTEAMDEAYDLAVRVKDEKRTDRYAKAILAAHWFDLYNQYGKGNSYWMPNPARALGGLKGSPIANDIRIDYTQHAITGWLHGLHVVEKYQGAGKLSPTLDIIDVTKAGIDIAEAEKRIKAKRGDLLEE